jgi:hypothetical protein
LELFARTPDLQAKQVEAAWSRKIGAVQID